MLATNIRFVSVHFAVILGIVETRFALCLPCRSTLRRGDMKHIIATLLAFPLIAGALAAQSGSVSGIVTGTENAPLAHARLKVLGTEIASESKADGSYRLMGLP